ncbi:hypothetical protein ACRAWD_06055 [Caulobacter segnis]
MLTPNGEPLADGSRAYRFSMDKPGRLVPDRHRHRRLSPSPRWAKRTGVYTEAVGR